MEAPVEDEMERPEPRVVRYWQLANLAASVAVLGAFAITFGPLVWLLPEPSRTWLTLVVTGLFLVAAILSVVTPSVRYRTFRFLVTPRHLWVRDGLLFHREKVVPASRVQHVDVASGPIERAQGLASLTIFTAGGRAATYRIPGLTRMRAEALRSRVLEVADRRPRAEARAPAHERGSSDVAD